MKNEKNLVNASIKFKDFLRYIKENGFYTFLLKGGREFRFDKNKMLFIDYGPGSGELLTGAWYYQDLINKHYSSNFWLDRHYFNTIDRWRYSMSSMTHKNVIRSMNYSKKIKRRNLFYHIQ